MERRCADEDQDSRPRRPQGTRLDSEMSGGGSWDSQRLDKQQTRDCLLFFLCSPTEFGKQTCGWKSATPGFPHGNLPSSWALATPDFGRGGLGVFCLQSPTST